jgi:hypothetical protein
LNATITPPSFGERFALATFSDGGVIVDLLTGTYGRLNSPATRICEALIAAEDVEAARKRVADRLQIDDAGAARAVAEIIDALNIPALPCVRPDPFDYSSAPDGEGYVLSSGGRPRLRISADGRVVRPASRDRPTSAQAFDYFRAIAPKLLFLQGAVVLHGSAFSAGEDLFAICGESGAGKTTTARAFGAVGALLFAEDMLVVASASPLTVRTGGEEVIRRWASFAADQLLATADVIDLTLLESVLWAETIAISEIWFIAAKERAEDTGAIVPRRLGTTNGALATMASLFLGATSPSEWRRFLDLAGAISRSTALFEAHMPKGLDRLRRAAELYIENSAL